MCFIVLDSSRSQVDFISSFRAVNIAPNRFLGLVGDHDNFPVENLSLSHCKKIVASCSHDEKVKFWDVSNLDSLEVDASKKSKPMRSAPKVGQRSAFFADLQDGASGSASTSQPTLDCDNDSDDSSSNDDEGDDVVTSSTTKTSSDTKQENDNESDSSDDVT